MAKDEISPAFPIVDYNGVHAKGMSLRDYFAGQALTGIASGYWANPQMGGLNSESLSEEAYNLADAMIAKRAKDTPL